MRFTFSARESAVAQIVSFDQIIEIVSPPDLAAAVVAHAEAAALKFQDNAVTRRYLRS